MDLPQVVGGLHKGNVHRHNHQGVVHDLDDVRIELFPGVLVAHHVALEGVLVLQTLAPLGRAAEVMEEGHRDTIHRLIGEEFLEAFTFCHDDSPLSSFDFSLALYRHLFDKCTRNSVSLIYSFV